MDEATLHKLSERIVGGATREEIIRSLHNIQGEPYPVDRATAAVNFARLGFPGEALVVENLVSFAPMDDKAYVIHAFSQVLVRQPSEVELARFTHQLEVGGITRLDLLELLNDVALSEGRHIAWDYPSRFPQPKGYGDAAETSLLVQASGFRALSESSNETLTLCRFTGQKWELAPSMITRTEDIRADSWVVSDGFILTGPKSTIADGFWVVELDVVQPEWASLVVDVVANAGIDRLLHVTAHGNVRGSFRFEKLRMHAFPEVRLRVQDAVPGQWISVQSVRLRKIG
ncbi:hypothetical protein IFT59_21935 [Rhizobium sp. CFBP 8752]|uniref:hypothetical protein n=1 Tax=Rhizobium sp. CFBP 8752 TaxID=2775301 RepID=UPI00177B6F11|nr:hypothetical protein [Rhizobium sp. CFBP 8752]MBD8665908.1 hypothetical protein [Rhizobium sp. CFBP 8752]